MNKNEYDQYTQAIDRFFTREEVNSLTALVDETCPCCNGFFGDDYFSWRACDCCDRPLGGSRYHATGYHPASRTILCYNICLDCMYYMEYGRLDDTTMWEVENA
jgi:hypothetical protein